MKVSQVLFTTMSVLLVQLGGATLSQCEASVGLTLSWPLDAAPSSFQTLSEEIQEVQASERFLAQEAEGSGEEGCPDANEDNECDVIEEGHGD